MASLPGSLERSDHTGVMAITRNHAQTIVPSSPISSSYATCPKSLEESSHAVLLER